jgi:PAS domain S-box-containing protein
MSKLQFVRRPLALRYHLVLLVAVALSPVLVFAALIVNDLGEGQRRSVEEGLQTSVRAVATAVDRQIAGTMESLSVLATSGDLSSGNLKAFREEALSAVAVNTFWYVIALTDARGQILVSTQRPYGAALPFIGDRGYIRFVIERGEPAVSDLILGRTTGALNVSVAVPVKRDGALRYVLFAGINPEALSGVIAAQRIPPTWISGVADTRQVIVARNRDPGRYVGKELIQPVKEAVRAAPSGIRRLPVYDAPDVYAAWYRVPSLGWTVTLGAPVSIVDAPIRKSMWKITIGGTVALLGGILLALVFGRRISREMGTLSDAAAAVGAGDTPPAHQSAIAEVTAVGGALRAAGATIKVRTEELIASQSAVKRLVDSSLIGILVGEDDQIVDANEAFLRIVGYTRVEMVRKRIPLRSLVPAGHELVDTTVVAEARATGEMAPYETEYVRKDGSRVPVLVGAAFLDDQRRRWVGFVLDLGERKRAEEERELRFAAETAARMKDEFLAIVSHELRTPLAAVLTSIRTLASKGLGPEDARAAIERIERSTRLQARLIDDLLDLSRIVAGKLRLDRKAVDLGSIADDAITALRPDAERKGVALTAEKAEGRSAPALVFGDPERLQQIVLNLVGNAIKFTPAGGAVVVNVALQDDRVILRVRDSGAGIAPELLPHIFERFAQGTPGRHHGGLGLGLAIVRHLVDAHRGSVRAESAGAGKGALFTVELPRLTDQAAPSSAA